MKTQPSSKQVEAPLRPSSNGNRVKKPASSRRPPESHDETTYTSDARHGPDTGDGIANGADNAVDLDVSRDRNNEASQELLMRRAPGSYIEDQPRRQDEPQQEEYLLGHGLRLDRQDVALCQVAPGLEYYLQALREAGITAQTQEEPDSYVPRYDQYGCLLSQLSGGQQSEIICDGVPVSYGLSSRRTSKADHLIADNSTGRLYEAAAAAAAAAAEADAKDEDEILDVDGPRFVCVGRYIPPQDSVLMDSGDGAVMPRGQELGMTTSREDEYDFGFRDRRTTPTFSQPIPNGLATIARDSIRRDDEEEMSVGATQYHIPAHQQATMNRALTGQPPLPQTYQGSASHTFASSQPSCVFGFIPTTIPQPLLESGQSVARGLNVAAGVQDSSDNWLLNSPTTAAPERSARLARLQAIKAENKKQHGCVELW